ncbi:MAG: hypothetical protein ACI9U0_000221 [Flavobacteriales bacterium]|jgi:hypothetical protein|tara:strand:- start:8814 stop:9368 length:555 start_codon:yes stop_codon:yes gene_type:complete
MSNTAAEFDVIIEKCSSLFLNKMKDYGTAWRILRTTSLTDQIFIKAQRIRTLEQNGESKVGEGILPEYIGIINYCVMAIIQLELGTAMNDDTSSTTIAELHAKYLQTAKDLMANKNHDYGEAWREMRVSSLTDLILMKLLRVKSIEDNEGKTIVSEGLDANYLDMINYSIFAMIRMGEAENVNV